LHPESAAPAALTDKSALSERMVIDDQRPFFFVLEAIIFQNSFNARGQSAYLGW
jgi:hypothetical protein